MTSAEMLKLLLEEEKRGGDGKFTPEIIGQKSVSMVAQDMPDHEKFCSGYPAECAQCREYISEDKSGLFCQLWEKMFPGKVNWHEKSEIRIEQIRRKNEKINANFMSKNTKF